MAKTNGHLLGIWFKRQHHSAPFSIVFTKTPSQSHHCLLSVLWQTFFPLLWGEEHNFPVPELHLQAWDKKGFILLIFVPPDAVQFPLFLTIDWPGCQEVMSTGIYDREAQMFVSPALRFAYGHVSCLLWKILCLLSVVWKAWMLCFICICDYLKTAVIEFQTC